MQTVRQFQRFWDAGQYERLARELLAARVEQPPRLFADFAHPAPAAALLLIRLEELHQSHHPLCQKLILAILRAQESDGGWGHPVLTAICLRALLANRGSGQSVARALACLAQLQKNDGSWPNEPIRRLAGDPFVTIWILFHLAQYPPFAHLVRLDQALNWLAQNKPKDGQTEQLCEIATLRSRIAQFDAPKLN